MQADVFSSVYLHPVENQKIQNGVIIGVEDRIEFWTMLKRVSALIGGWTIKGIRCVSEGFVSVLKGRMLLGGT